MSQVLNFKLVILIALVAFSASCKKDNKAPAPKAPPSETTIIGNWKTICVSDPNSTTDAEIQRIKITQTTVELINEDYYDKKCTTLPTITSILNTYTKSDDLLVLSGATSVKVKISDPADVVAANSTSHCGFNNWQKDVEKEVIGHACSDDFKEANDLTYKLSGMSLIVTTEENKKFTTTRE